MSDNRILLITSNVGSAFESSEICKEWLQSIVDLIRTTEPRLVALHMQEIGGKYFLLRSAEQNRSLAADFVEQLRNRVALLGYSLGSAYVDTRVDVESAFTALGSVYLVRESGPSTVEQWDFASKRFSQLTAFESINGASLTDCDSMETLRFPTILFPNMIIGRKGFSRTRWRLNGLIMDFVNIHLFHDESNLVALETPSIYKERRRRALDFVLDKTLRSNHCNESVFVFGDFNFRLDLNSTANHLAPNSTRCCASKDGKAAVYEYLCNSTNSCLLRVESKLFKPSLPFTHDSLRPFDRELANYPLLCEADVSFQPSYALKEMVGEPMRYEQKRAPAWCDRVLMNEAAWKLFGDQPLQYALAGTQLCTGDHKPVFLLGDLPTD